MRVLRGSEDAPIGRKWKFSDFVGVKYIYGKSVKIGPFFVPVTPKKVITKALKTDLDEALEHSSYMKIQKSRTELRLNTVKGKQSTLDEDNQELRRKLKWSKDQAFESE